MEFIKRNILIILGAVAIVAAVGVSVYQWQGGPRGTAPAPQPALPAVSSEDLAKAKAIADTDFTLGRADAPVTVIEYASLTCPVCAAFHTTVLPRIKSDYIDTGKVRMAFRDFPLDRAALAAAMVARCAGKDRHYAMIDLFLTRQSAWRDTPDPLAAMTKLAGLAGMGEAEVQACLKKDAVEKAVLDQRLLSEKVFNVDSTPTLIINGVKHRTLTFEEFQKAADPLLATPAK